jgi:imidazolonepropionase-like amidohydrolase
MFRCAHANILLRILLLLLLASPVLAAERGDLLIRDVHLVDPETQTVTAGHMLVRDGKIAQIWHSALPDDVTATQVLEGQHKWLMPGLFDLHVHATGDPAPTEPEADDLAMDPTQVALRMASVGVTEFLDLGNEPGRIFAARDAAMARAAHVDAAGPVWIQARKPSKEAWAHSAAAFVTGPRDAARKIAEYIDIWHPDVVKVIYDHSEGRSSMDMPTLRAIVTAAHAKRTKIVAHIQLWQDMRDAVNAGADAVTHLDDATDIPDDVILLLKSHHVCEIPTLGVQMGLADFVDHPELLADLLLQKLETAEFLARFRHPENFGLKGKFWLDWQHKSRATYLRSVKKLFAAGVCVLPGSDTDNIGVIQGWSLHRELELYQEAGVPAWEVLRAATMQAAQFVGSDAGRLKDGARANLLLLDADPTLKLSHTRQIHSVVRNGHVL